jgi:flagellar motor switch protein FliM
MEPLKGYALLIIEAPLVFAFVEFFFGGNSANHVKSEGRSFTTIEQRIIKKVVDMALSDVAEAWSGMESIKPDYVSSEMNPQFVTIVTPSEIVIKIEVHIELEDFVGKLFFCIPYSMIEPVKEKLYSGIQSDKFEMDQRWVSMLREMLLESYAEVAVELANVQLTVSDIMNLEKGSVINLGKCVSDDMMVKVERKPKFAGMPGFSRGNQAVKITKVL